MKKSLIFLVLLSGLSFFSIKLEKNQPLIQSSDVYADTTQTVTLKLRIIYNADIDNSGRVDGKDLALLMYSYGKDISGTGYKDINGNKIFDFKDAEIMESHFGLTR